MDQTGASVKDERRKRSRPDISSSTSNESQIVYAFGSRLNSSRHRAPGTSQIPTTLTERKSDSVLKSGKLYVGQNASTRRKTSEEVETRKEVAKQQLKNQEMLQELKAENKSLLEANKRLQSRVVEIEEKLEKLERKNSKRTASMQQNSCDSEELEAAKSIPITSQLEMVEASLAEIRCIERELLKV